MKTITIVLLFFFIGGLLGQSTLVPKQLAGEPSEFSSFYLPNPQSVAQSSDSSLLSVSLLQSKTTDNFEWIGTIPVDSVQQFTLSFFSNFNDLLVIEAFPPTPSKKVGGHHRRFAGGNSPSISNGTFGIDGNMLVSLTYSWDKPTIGDWTIKVTAPSVNVTADNSNLIILVQNPSNLQIYSYLSSYNNLFVGEQVNIIAMIYDDTLTLEKGQLPKAVKLQPGSAQINLVAPDGQSSTIDMYDDGEHSDFEANDGIYGGSLTPNEIGNYEAQIFFRGSNPSMVEDSSDSSSSGSGSLVNLVRSNQHIIPITNEYIVFAGNVVAEQDTTGDVNFYFEVDVNVPVNTTVPDVRIYSEIWGANNVPVAWIGGVSSLTTYQNASSLSAFLDQRWIALANATAPFTVKNIIISDLNTFIPLSNQSTYSLVKMANKYHDVRHKKFSPPLSAGITKDMRDGKMPKHLADRYGKNPGGNGKLILVHGYCADDNPWPLQDFTNAVQFEDFLQNRPNDEFARLVGAFGEQFTDGFSLVGHSQGGNQALHLFTYYHTGLDLSTAYSGNVLQSMGTPYQGTALAGTLASIGSAIGIGCSSNNDLTLDGAALWLNTIPQDKRSYVYYTTTQYKTGSLINYCSLPANMVLSWANDGVVDLDHSTLEGANYVQNIKGWCHTTDMKSPPQTSNTENNKLLNQNSVW